MKHIKRSGDIVKKQAEIVYEYDKNKIILRAEEVAENLLQSFEIETDAPDIDDAVEFTKMMLEVLAAFAENHVVLYFVPYARKVLPKEHRFSLKPQDVTFEEDCIASRLKNKLVETDWDDGVLYTWQEEHEEKGLLFGKCTVQQKALYIIQEHFDMQLFLQTDVSDSDEFGHGCGIRIFPEGKLEKKATEQETYNAYNSANGGQKSLLTITLNVESSRGSFLLNKKYMSENEMVSVIEKVIERYGKYLEVTE